MSKMKIYAKLLAIAAVLAIGFSACTKTDPDILSAKPQKIHVSLKANVNDLQTSSSIDYVNGVRTLKISAGDKLYVRAVVGTTWNDDICDFWESILLCGYLTVEPTTISPSGNSASFTCDMDVYTGDLTYTMDQIWIVDEPEHDEWEIVDLDPDTGEEIWDMIHYDEVGERDQMQTVCPTSEVSAEQLGSHCSVLQSGPNADNGLSSNGTTPTNPHNLSPQLVLDAKVNAPLSTHVKALSF